jgi:hypothetical protein
MYAPVYGVCYNQAGCAIALEYTECWGANSAPRSTVPPNFVAENYYLIHHSSAYCKQGLGVFWLPRWPVTEEISWLLASRCASALPKKLGTYHLLRILVERGWV